MHLWNLPSRRHQAERRQWVACCRITVLPDSAHVCGLHSTVIGQIQPFS
ncbi:hypothetical protein BN2475_680003 [Paraburkholderia ribeironis]|uniref:Uncharacterized protein n=1 Tax=Paraburkholderia ribeironis TaxID=1247936 RepID=A0A1N7SGT4_9BURK|nr:hypothetical protein BN2475_680003 [Paraburkholderia ribeironis]